MTNTFDCKKFKDLSDRQIRAYFTVYCIENNIELDTKEWDDLVDNIYTNYYCSSTLNTKKDFDLYMGRELC